jgi:hypothetical protein
MLAYVTMHIIGVQAAQSVSLSSVTAFAHLKHFVRSSHTAIASVEPVTEAQPPPISKFVSLSGSSSDGHKRLISTQHAHTHFMDSHQATWRAAFNDCSSHFHSASSTSSFCAEQASSDKAFEIPAVPKPYRMLGALAETQNACEAASRPCGVDCAGEVPGAAHGDTDTRNECLVLDNGVPGSANGDPDRVNAALETTHGLPHATDCGPDASGYHASSKTYTQKQGSSTLSRTIVMVDSTGKPFIFEEGEVRHLDLPPASSEVNHTVERELWAGGPRGMAIALMCNHSSTPVFRALTLSEAVRTSGVGLQSYMSAGAAEALERKIFVEDDKCAIRHSDGAPAFAAADEQQGTIDVIVDDKAPHLDDLIDNKSMRQISKASRWPVGQDGVAEDDIPHVASAPMCTQRPGHAGTTWVRGHATTVGCIDSQAIIIGESADKQDDSAGRAVAHKEHADDHVVGHKGGDQARLHGQSVGNDHDPNRNMLEWSAQNNGRFSMSDGASDQNVVQPVYDSKLGGAQRGLSSIPESANSLKYGAGHGSRWSGSPGCSMLKEAVNVEQLDELKDSVLGGPPQGPPRFDNLNSRS